MADELDSNVGAAPAEHAPNDTASSLERREALRRFGTYAACAAPVLTVLMASRQSEAGGFIRNSRSAATAVAGRQRRWRRWRRWWWLRLLLLTPAHCRQSSAAGA